NGFDSLVFTVGCHAGFSVSDVQLQNPALDWAQLNAQNTNQFVAHTTYGYGDTTIVAYSERLAQLFAENVAAMVGPTASSDASLGQAVRDAKERYLAGTLVLTPYDEKILQSWTYYGLPMYTLGDIGEPNPGPDTTGATGAQTTTFLELAGATTLLASAPLVDGPASFATENGTTTVDIDLSGDALERVDVAGPPASSYYQVDGNAIVAQYRPVQPLVDVEIPVPGTYQGFLVTGLTSEDLPATYVPFYSNPLIDNSANETRIVVGDGAFPATLQRVNDVTGGQRLLVAAGEYESGQRLFRRISGELIPRNPDKPGDDLASRFLDVVGLRVADVGGTGKGVQFDVITDDDAVRAVVLFREFGTTEWRSVELAGRAAVDGRRGWFGSAPLLTSGNDVEFFVQNVDDAGNVGISRNKIENFSTSDADDPGGPGVLGIEYVGPEDKEFAGRYYPSGAVFKIVGGSTETRFSIDSGPPLDYNPTTGIEIRYTDGGAGAYDPVTGVLELDRGPHVLFAQEGGDRVYRFFILDPDAATVEVILPTTGWASGPVDVTITATDSGAGVKAIDCSGCENAVLTINPVTGVASKKITVSAEGVTTISATATDNVGNVSAPSTADVRIDTTAPQVRVAPATTPWSATPVDVTITATDTGSGVASINYDCGTGTCTEISSIPDPGTGVASKVVRVSSGGITTVSATATDNVGKLSAPATAAVQVDLTDPTITSFSVTPDADGDGIYTLGEAVTATFTCADAPSGLASCELFDGTSPVAPPFTIDTSIAGTHQLTVRATDLAGRTTTSAPITVTVATYGICLLYDPTQEKNIGSNYTIKLRLCDSQGRNLSARNITLTALTVDLNLDPGPNFSGKANDGYEFRYNASDASYIYNLDTTALSAGNHRLYFTTRQVPKPRPSDPATLNTYIDAAPAPFALR
ncbi:MAG TPA: hypothetical protein VLN74_10550, partial [Ilumatobacteraceae bacterium]|nr:hypothetical protein [Ilumatobacteraceae bacterium]